MNDQNVIWFDGAFSLSVYSRYYQPKANGSKCDGTPLGVLCAVFIWLLYWEIYLLESVFDVLISRCVLDCMVLTCIVSKETPDSDKNNIPFRGWLENIPCI